MNSLIDNRHRSRKVLVLGEDTRIVLAILRSLGRCNVGVDLGWCPPHSPARRSRYVRRVHDIPPFRPDDDRWKERLSAILDSERFDLVIPATEASSYVLHKTRKDWEHRAPIHLLSQCAFDFTSDKLKTYELAESLGIDPPPYRVVSKHIGADQVVRQLGLPLVFKPRWSMRPGEVLSKSFVRTVDSVDKLSACMRDATEFDDHFLVQKYVPGKGVGVEVLAEDGDVLFAFQHERLHETIGHGSTYRKSVSLDAELLAAASRLMKALRYTGVAMVEYRVDLARREWKLLEVNGRFWGSLPLAVASGADFPHYLYQLLVEKKRDFRPDYRVGVHCRTLIADARWFMKNVAQRRSDSYRKSKANIGWEINYTSRAQALRELLHIATLRDHFDTFSLDDTRPSLLDAQQLCRTIARRMSGAIRPDCRRSAWSISAWIKRFRRSKRPS